MRGDDGILLPRAAVPHLSPRRVACGVVVGGVRLVPLLVVARPLISSSAGDRASSLRREEKRREEAERCVLWGAAERMAVRNRSRQEGEAPAAEP